jgi:hypothetical protein
MTTGWSTRARERRTEAETIGDETDRQRRDDVHGHE